ncbi:hypothetical protein C8J57DRAFT_1473757, partial [Mycena rebaudengoi]
MPPAYSETRPHHSLYIYDPNPSKPRKPKASARKIRPSSFRPHVLAIHRFKNWHSPHSAKIRVARRDRFSTATLLAHDKVLDAALGTGSHSNYGGGLAWFHEFCDLEDIPENDRMPASEELIAMFIASWAGRISRIRAWHIVHGASWLMDDHLRFIKNGVTNLVPESSTRAPRPPVTIPHISALRENLSLNNTFDSAVLACAECAFFGCNRLGELLPTSHISYDPSKFATRTSISFDSDPAGKNFYAIKAPWTKTTGCRVAFAVPGWFGWPCQPRHLTLEERPALSPTLSSWLCKDHRAISKPKGFRFDRRLKSAHTCIKAATMVPPSCLRPFPSPLVDAATYTCEWFGRYVISSCSLFLRLLFQFGSGLFIQCCKVSAMTVQNVITQRHAVAGSEVCIVFGAGALDSACFHNCLRRRCARGSMGRCGSMVRRLHLWSQVDWSRNGVRRRVDGYDLLACIVDMLLISIPFPSHFCVFPSLLSIEHGGEQRKGA